MSNSEAIDVDPLTRCFTPLIGLPAWLVRKGYGSFLTLEFGAPHLRVREPVTASRSASMRRRRVAPAGEWHLWIYCCEWRVLSHGEELARSTSPDAAIHAAAGQIDGQALTQVSAEPSTGLSTFSFDDGAVLETSPWSEDNDDQWMLFMPSGNVFSYRRDGYYNLGAGKQPESEKVWRPLPPSGRHAAGGGAGMLGPGPLHD